MSDGSESEIESASPKKIKKPTKSAAQTVINSNDDQKKLSTKVMIHKALTDLKTRKGTSFYSIKKYIEEHFNVDVKKNNYIIKKFLKAGVEAGTITQTTGVGASGSFKLVTGKEKVEKKEAKTKKIIQKSKQKEAKNSPDKAHKRKIEEKPKVKKNFEKLPAKKKVEKETVAAKEKSNTKPKKKKVVLNENEESKAVKTKKSKAVKSSKELQTPVKKRISMMKRKSIGSIVKKPRMKPAIVNKK